MILSAHYSIFIDPLTNTAISKFPATVIVGVVELIPVERARKQESSVKIEFGNKVIVEPSQFQNTPYDILPITFHSDILCDEGSEIKISEASNVYEVRLWLKAKRKDTRILCGTDTDMDVLKSLLDGDEEFCPTCKKMYPKSHEAFGKCPEGHPLLHETKCQKCKTKTYFQIDDDYCGVSEECGILCSGCVAEIISNK